MFFSCLNLKINLKIEMGKILKLNSTDDEEDI